MASLEWRINQTLKPIFTFVEFTSDSELKLLMFSLFLMMYILTLFANSFIITIVKVTPSLHTPMYMFIASLSLLEVSYVTVTTPNILSIIFIKNKQISIEGCMAQFYVFFSLGSAECLLLTVMAGDRYLAICKPLRYSSLMTTRTCLHLTILCYVGGFAASVPIFTFFAILPFCKSKEINHFFCDYPALLTLACIEEKTREKIFFSLPSGIVMTCLLLIVVSYVCIVFTIKVSRKTQSKAFSTCVSHLTVVLIFYGTVIFMYVRPKATYDLNRDKVVSVVYSVVTPLLNPMIYSLRNKQFQKAVLIFYVRHFAVILCRS